MKNEASIVRDKYNDIYLEIGKPLEDKTYFRIQPFDDPRVGKVVRLSKIFLVDLKYKKEK